MNKQKTLIFSLSAMLFLTTSFLVYSWVEPTTTMPGSYTAPINTSGTAQTKTGEFGASSFVDANNPSYYLNPSGNCKIAGGITSDLTIENINSSDSKTLVTREYLDFALSKLNQEVITNSSNMLYVDGTNPVCPTTMLVLFRHSSAGWALSSGSLSSWDAVVCAQSSLYDGTPYLAYYIHSSLQCSNSGGTPVTATDGNIICKFNASTCPSGWARYMNYMATSSCSAAYSGTALTCPVSGHAFSNVGQSTAYIGVCYNVAMSSITRSCCGYECTHNFDYCYSSRYSSCTTSISEIGCY